MTRIYLVRHAQAEGNFYRRAQGNYDGLVTPQGYQQIEALKRRFADIPVDVVYSSPAYRTRTTASAIYTPKNIPLYVMKELREVDCGPWEDRTWGDIHYREPEQLYNFNYHFDQWHVEGAENAEQVKARICAALDTIVRECPGKNVAVVSHGMTCRILLGTLMGLSLKEICEDFPHGDNTAVSMIEYENGKYNVVYANDNSHLSDGLSTFAHQEWWKCKEYREIGLRFTPLDIMSDAGAAIYELCRAEAWMCAYGKMDHYDGASMLADARAHAGAYGEAVLAAWYEDEFAGLLQLDVTYDGHETGGWIAFVYLAPEYRGKGVGPQMIGEAVSHFRRFHCDRIHLRCSQSNAAGLKFYQRCGFHKIGEEHDPVSRDILELYIGY